MDFLLVHAEKMEGDYGKLVWLFAGYKKEMEKLLEHNPGLLSRFPNKFVFEDYTDEELLDIFLNLLQEQAATTSKKIKFTVSEPKWARIAIRRLGNQRGKSGFGNARAVRGLFDATKKRQSERIVNERKNQKYPDIFEFVRNDLLGPKASRETIESSSSWQSLQAMEGLKEVKEAMQQLVELIIQNAEREDAERPVHQVALNRIFLGNPGTGMNN